MISTHGVPFVQSSFVHRLSIDKCFHRAKTYNLLSAVLLKVVYNLSGLADKIWGGVNDKNIKKKKRDRKSVV